LNGICDTGDNECEKIETKLENINNQAEIILLEDKNGVQRVSGFSTAGSKFCIGLGWLARETTGFILVRASEE
jgi:hypothetical protein